MTRPAITVKDMMRLLAERNSSTQSNDDWFERNGFDKHIQPMLVRTSKAAMGELLLEAVATSEDDPPEIMANICATFMLSGFSLGWEVHKQYGGGQPPPPRKRRWRR